MLEDSQQYEAFRSSIRTISFLQRVVRPLYSRLPQSLTLWRLLGGHVVARSFFSHAMRARGTKRLVEKTPSHVQYVDHIFSVFSDAYVLVCVRHPLDVYSSYRRRLQSEQKLGRNPSWLDVSPATFINRYRTAIEAGLKYQAQYPGNVLTVRYEDFVSSPEESFRKMCSFVDIPFEQAPLEGGCEALASWQPDPHLARPITKSTKNWWDYMTSSEAEEIERSLSKVLKDLGYEAKHRSN